MKAIEVIKLMSEILSDYLEDLKDAKAYDRDAFAYGERTAYTECLEMLQLYDDPKELGLDYDIEKKYPL